MAQLFSVDSEDFSKERRTFSIGLENDALVVSHDLVMPADTSTPATTMLVAVKFTKGRIEVNCQAHDSNEKFGAVYTQSRNGRYTCEETGNSDYHDGMKSMGEALFMGAIYPDMIRAALGAVKKLNPEQAQQLTTSQRQLAREPDRLLRHLKPSINEI